MRWILIWTAVVVWAVVISQLFAQPPRAPEPQAVMDPAQAFQTGFLVVRGEGVAPPSVTHAGLRSIQALRAAHVVAYRELLEALKGVQVSSETTVAGAMLGNDLVRTRMEGLVQGAEAIYKHYDPQADVGIVYLRLPVKGAGSVTTALLPQIAAEPLPSNLIPFPPAPPSPMPPPAAAQPSISKPISWQAPKWCSC